jgi:hypothetical protein
MASKNKDERAHVNALIKALQKNSPGVYVHIDRDAGGVRHTSSGWDFFLACGGSHVFCEAKEENSKLSDWQEYTRALVRSANCDYHVVRFWVGGEFFSIDSGDQIRTADATLQHFFKIIT